MLLLIDNYDSFTYNLVHYLGELGTDIVVKRNDAIDVQEAMAMKPEGILLSPGPCDPDQAGICLALTSAAAETRTPLIGVCLGHQTIGQAFGGNVVRCHEIVHGINNIRQASPQLQSSMNSMQQVQQPGAANLLHHQGPGKIII